MKKILLIIAVVLSVISCTKDDGLLLKAKMTAKIDSTDWNSATRITVLKNETFNIVGAAVDGKTIEITILGTDEGTYSLPLSSDKFAAFYKETPSSSADETYTATSGEVILSDVNTSTKEISGTFHLLMRKGLIGDTLSISKGIFENLKYTESH
jgi:hypothetical protein